MSFRHREMIRSFGEKEILRELRGSTDQPFIRKITSSQNKSKRTDLAALLRWSDPRSGFGVWDFGTRNRFPMGRKGHGAMNRAAEPATLQEINIGPAR